MKKILVLIMTVVLTIPAWADKNTNTKFPRGLQFGMGVSATSGLNAFVGYNNKKFDSFWAKRFGVRLDLASCAPIKKKLNRELNDAIGNDGTELDDHLTLDNLAVDGKHYGAMVDFYPFGDTWFLGGWRISGGYMFGNIDVNADIHGQNVSGRIEFELGGTRYYYENTDVRAKSNVKWKYHGPYVGTGFDLGLFWGFKIYMDTGVVFANRAAKLGMDVPLEGLKRVSDNADVSLSELESSKSKAIKEVQDDLDKYPYYPLIKVGFMYRF